MTGEAPASAPPLPSPLSPLQEAAEVQPARDAGAGALAPDGAAPQAPGGSDPQPHMPPPAQRAGARSVGQRRPMQTLCVAHRAPACKSCRGHRGVRHCCSRHHEGHPRLVPAAGGAPAHAVWAGGPVHGCLGWGGGGGSDGDNGEGAPQGSGAALAPTGRLGSPRRGHGRAEGADT